MIGFGMTEPGPSTERPESLSRQSSAIEDYVKTIYELEPAAGSSVTSNSIA